MTSKSELNTRISINVTRTRITVLTMNLTIIALILSILHGMSERNLAAHLTSTIALITSFCLTLFGLFCLLHSQNLDREGSSQPMSFALGTVTAYLALSQTLTAFVHEYLVTFMSQIKPSRHILEENVQQIIHLEQIGDSAVLILFVMCGSIWAVMTYLGPLLVIRKSPVDVARRWVLVIYYIAVLLPVYWVYARAWHVQFAQADVSTSTLQLFALQFVQPLLWFN